MYDEFLGDKMQTVCAIFVHESLYGCGIAYTITAASSVKYVFLINPLSATVFLCGLSPFHGFMLGI